MKRSLMLFTAAACGLLGVPAHADFFGGDLPLLAQIVTNTLNTLNELQNQSEMLRSELRGIDDKINRLKTLSDLLKTEDYSKWKDPREAARRLSTIYYMVPRELRTEKSDEIEREISRAMSLAAQLVAGAHAPFASGKQMEDEALRAGPAVANKMTASGVGTLVALQSQNQVAQATVISLLSQMVADGASREVARLKTQSQDMKTASGGLSPLSRHIRLTEIK